MKGVHDLSQSESVEKLVRTKGMKVMLGAESLGRCPMVLGSEIGIDWGEEGQNIPGKSPCLEVIREDGQRVHPHSPPVCL